MTSSKPLPVAPRPPHSGDEALCLLGITRLPDFIAFVRKRAIDGVNMDRGDLTEQWRDAAAVFKELQVSEAGAADKPDINPLPPLLQAHVRKLVKLAHFEQTFSSVPVAFGMVELDKLIVSQQHIMRSSVDKMTSSLAVPLSDADLAGVCLPLTPSDSDFRLALEEDERFVFVSDTHDARFLGAQLVNPADIKGFKVSGHPQAVVALSVGFTTNVLNVVRFGSRIVLNNGYHRAFALRQLGVTHAPCLIQVCGHWEDVGLAGSSEMYENGEVYFSAARPPLLRDYANPALTQTFATKRLRKTIQLSYEVDSAQMEL